MPEGMRRTTIMSHGRMHDAAGVKGTHLRGTVPKQAVLDAIPVTVGSVGQLAESAAPGDPNATPVRDPVNVTFDSQKRRSGLMIDGEGDLVLPGGNRSDQAFMTSRPASTEDAQVPDVSTHDDVTASAIRRAVTADEAEAAAVESEEAPVEPAEAPEPPEAPEDTSEASEVPEEAPVVETPWPQDGAELAEWLSKRKVTRGKVDELAAWCVILNIDPDEYVDEGEAVTGTLMRTLIVQNIDEEYGVVIEL